MPIAATGAGSYRNEAQIAHDEEVAWLAANAGKFNTEYGKNRARGAAAPHEARLEAANRVFAELDEYAERRAKERITDAVKMSALWMGGIGTAGLLSAGAAAAAGAAVFDAGVVMFYRYDTDTWVSYVAAKAHVKVG